MSEGQRRVALLQMESEIDCFVYQLYGLTEDDGVYQSSEIRIVERVSKSSIKYDL